MLKTMLLSEAWQDEFQLCIIRKHINVNWCNTVIWVMVVLVYNLLAEFIDYSVLIFQGRFI